MEIRLRTVGGGAATDISDGTFCRNYEMRPSVRYG